MRFLRTASTRRLLAVIAGLVAAVIATAAIAVAASGPGPVPKAQPLASAVHQALSGPKVAGITADITFTNHLIDASALQGSDPILTGATGRLWLGDHRLRLELQSNNGDVEVLIDHNRFWVSDPAANTVYQGTLPKGTDGRLRAPDSAHKDHGIPSIAQIQKALTKLMTPRQPVRGDPRERRRPARLHGQRLAAARRRPARLGRDRLGRDPRRAAAPGRLRPRQQHAGARAARGQHQLRRRARLGLQRRSAHRRQGGQGRHRHDRRRTPRRRGPVTSATTPR